MAACSHHKCKKPANTPPLYCRCGAQFCSETCFVSAWHAGHRTSCSQRAAIQADLDSKPAEGGKGKVRQLCLVALSKVAPAGLDETMPTTLPAAAPATPPSVPVPTTVPTATTTVISTPPVPAAPTSSISCNAPSGTSSSKSAVKTYKFEEFEEVPGGRLGQGGFGSVHKVKHKTNGDEFAMKVVPKQMVEQHKMSEYLFREVKAQLKLQHPKILRLFYYFEDAENVHLLLEYASGGSLFHRLQRVGRLPEPEAGPAFAGIVSALGYIHENGYIHRDLKPENILLCDGGTAKLADFGWCAEIIKGAQRQTFCGTVAYLSPEMILNEPHGHEVDIWAVGVLLFELLVGRTPWNSTPQVGTLRKQANAELTIPNEIHAEARNLISSLLKVKPDERLPLNEVLQHSWVRRNAPQDAIASPRPCPLQGSQLDETVPTTGPAFTALGERDAPRAAPAAAAPQTAMAASQAENISSAGRQPATEAIGLGAGLGNFSFGDARLPQDGKRHLIEDFPLLLGSGAPPVQQKQASPQSERKNEAHLIESFPLLFGAGAPAASSAPSFGVPGEHEHKRPPRTVSPQLGSKVPSQEISPVVIRVPLAAKPRAVVTEVSPIQTGRAPSLPLASQPAGFRYAKPGDTISPVVVTKVPPPQAQHKSAATATVDTISPILQRRAPSLTTLQPPATTHRDSADTGQCLGSLPGSIGRQSKSSIKKLVSLDDLDDESDNKNAVERQAFPSFTLPSNGKGNRALGF